MDKIEKLCRKLSCNQSKIVIKIIEKILVGKISNLDIKKLQGYHNVFRVRKGRIRIIFKRKKSVFNIISIDYRSENTYKKIIP